ncbi:MAG: acetolactate synthase large subunit [Frankiaceae bacterium]|nr:acetolactate synthase large subunit [Frankiaceae bacterium]
MNGAESLLRTASAAGIDLCLANPGTTEMPLVTALDGEPGIRPVLGLFEGVVTGAADGFGRLAGRPAMTLLHLGPGFANGIANLHNARRAGTPVVNVIGDMATWHRPYDAPLSSDIASLARPVSDWFRATARPEDVPGDMADAIAAATSRGGDIATLVVPADCLWSPSTAPALPRPPVPRSPVPDAAVAETAEALSSGRPAALLLGPSVLTANGLALAGRIAALTGARLLTEKFPARVERGRGLPAPERLGYFPEQAAGSMAGLETVVLVGARTPVTFFGYPDTPSLEVPPEVATLHLASRTDDALAALAAVLERLPQGDATPTPEAAAPEMANGPLTPEIAGAVLAALQPEGAVVVDEALTSSAPYWAAAAGSAPHTALSLTGGAIGQGLPSAAGAALACPDRRVIAYQADGSGLYTAQSLWTMARESLDVTVVVCANRRYRILQAEQRRDGVTEPGAASRRFTALDDPAVDWVSLARAYGVEGRQVETAEQLADALRQSFGEPGPRVIEALL